MPSLTPKLYLALIHHPVINKHHEVICGAVTNLDLHDIARAARTYGVCRYYVVTPLEDQQQMIERLTSHWTKGHGSTYNPRRREALEMIRITASLEMTIEDIRPEVFESPVVVATSAREPSRQGQNTTDFKTLRSALWQGRPHLLLLGTAWGLAEEILDQADLLLAPIAGQTGYNHLSVRCAAAIMLDRLLGDRQTD